MYLLRFKGKTQTFVSYKPEVSTEGHFYRSVSLFLHPISEGDNTLTQSTYLTSKVTRHLKTLHPKPEINVTANILFSPSFLPSFCPGLTRW